MRTLVLDTNAVNDLIDQADAVDQVQAAVDAGRLELLYTHDVLDEVVATRDLERRRRLALALVSLGRLVPSGACVRGTSRIGWARLSENSETINAVQSEAKNHTRDALIAATASHEGAALVTRDDRLVDRARALGIKIISVPDMLQLA